MPVHGLFGDAGECVAGLFFESGGGHYFDGFRIRRRKGNRANAFMEQSAGMYAAMAGT